ncbi:MAG TPA: tRNA epoxyqueuosine(34) reductase QueG [Kiritimatiellia bacterium]|nr:tRNA epoxyqueuosine(34) reductase QueG [Kiritimatiellia bacterium]HRZ12846.1 tRNA epoxyqueuosine(34) reductase QueG [Kiritimatiellia bacterium]HSA18202.1 tRNA epoxyqueuosine(34) reductase QueG [Kiritimatiellia bacterium]
MNLSARIRQTAQDLGFDLAGIAPAAPPACRDFLRESAARGYAADMSWLGRSAARRGQPDAVLPGARSVVALGCSYFTTWPEDALALDPLRGRIAAFAWGPDYHAVLKPRLEELGRFIEREKPGATWRAYADTGPILERHFAGRAGLGFVGRNTQLIHPRMGSMILLGVLLLDQELEYDAPTPGSCAGEEPHPCGRCARCLQACPAGALPEPFRLDARRCLSYLTIEHRGAIPPELRPRLGNWIFGCDECQAACPWVRRFSRPASRPFLRFEPDRWAPRLAELLDLDERAFRERYGGTPLERTGRARLIRNAIVALGNSGRAEARPALERWMSGPDEGLREHALWAARRLDRLDGSASAQENSARPVE